MVRNYEEPQSKEIFIHAELYRILVNACADTGQRNRMRALGGVQGRTWEPDRVLIEPSLRSEDLKESRQGADEPDIVLVGWDGYAGKKKPMLVIEVKQRGAANPTQRFKSALDQAHGYAKQIRCPLYSAYDGHNMVVIQNAFPFLIGLQERSIHSSEAVKVRFAKGLWGSVCVLAGSSSQGPYPQLCSPLDYHPWRKTVRILIRDAYKRYLEDSGTAMSDDTLMSTVEDIAQSWDRMTWH